MNDSCPNCLHREVEPRSVTAVSSRAELSLYRCPRCRHMWETERIPDTRQPSHDTQYDDPEAWEADDEHGERPW